jgi:hypothetical protein
MQPIKIVIALFCFSCAFNIKAQIEEPDIQEELEPWIENEEGIADYQDLMDQTLMGKSRKIDLNKATYQDLSKIPFLNYGQIVNLMNHRKKYGSFISVFELQVVDGFDEDLVRRLIHFVEVKESIFEIFKPTDRVEKNATHELVYTYGERMERSRGYFPQNDSTGPAFSGNPQRHVFRYRFVYKDGLIAGFTGEKDAGEPFMSGHNPMGFDFNSFHLFYRAKKGIIKNIALGDFQAAFGQGLTFGSGMAFGKSPFVLNIKRNQQGLRPYRSLNENDFLRGAGISLGSEKLTATMFAAVNNLDGTVRQGDTLKGFYFSSFGTTGLHRTEAEIANKNAVNRKITGANVHYSGESLNLGYTVVNTFYDLPFIPSSQLYNHYRYSGQSLFNHGIHYSLQKKNALFLGELSSNGISNGLSTVQGMLLSLGKSLDFAVLHRHIARDYHFTYSTAFTENSGVSNEKGTYMGFVFKPSYQWTVNVYYDMVEFPWLRFRIDGPSSGRDLLLETHYTKRKRYTVYGRLRARIRQINNREGTPMNFLEETRRLQFMLHSQYFISDKLTIKSRAEWVKFDMPGVSESKQYGQTVFTDLVRIFPRIQTRVIGRFMVFRTDGFDSRIYAFENDVLYSFTIPAFQHSGTRFFLLTKTRITRKTDLWIRLARTRYSNISSIGSGQDRIDKPHLTDIKLQLRVRL